AAGPALAGRAAIHAAAAGDRQELLDGLLRGRLARVLGTTPDRLDGDRPLLQLGLDSLMAVELRNWIEGELQVNLPIVELMRSPSVAQLAAVLAEQFAAENQGQAAAPHSNGTPHEPPNGTGHPPSPALATAPDDLLARVEDLS